jgi:hypothetical protein
MADSRDWHNGDRRAPGAGEAEEARQRRARRLAEDLGVNAAGVQVILHLRGQVVALQARLAQLEGELRIERARSARHLARYRREYYEATWEDTL